MIFGPKAWTIDDLAEHLTAAGIESGDNIILHSSLKSVGKTASGPATVINAILATIGPTGNLMAPTFTYSLPAWKGEPFSHSDSRARTGAIPEYMRHRPDAVRSFHPTHSVTVVGPDRDAIIANHMQATPLGRQSPFGRMLERNAKILMLGTHQDTNSSLHLCEVLAELPYIRVCFSDDVDYETAWYHNGNDEIRFMKVNEVPGCSRGFRAIEPALISRGILRQVYVGDATSQLLYLPDLVTAATEILAQNPTLLLCHVPNCGICPKRRSFMQNLLHDFRRRP
jgi:aminoglycoside 3-N-acetyltransferase